MPRSQVTTFIRRRARRQFQWGNSIRKIASFLIVAVWACSCSTHVRPSLLRSQQEIREATARYADLVLRMDNGGIAALFASDGEIAVDGREPIRGRANIEAFLEGFKDFHVLAESLTADSIQINGARAHVIGKYRQRVRVPSGDTVEVEGAYTGDWIQDISGPWRIRRIATVSTH